MSKIDLTKRYEKAMKKYPNAHPIAEQLSKLTDGYIGIDNDEELCIDGHFKIADLRKVFGANKETTL